MTQPKIYYINLDRSPDRRQFMNDQFHAFGLPAERIPAVDGEHIDLGSHPESGLSPGEIGCFLSHRAAWKKLVESSDPNAIIFEDDAHLSPDLPRLLADMSWLPADAMIVKLDTNLVPVVLDPARHEVRPSRSLRRLRTAHMGASGYILSRDAANVLLEKSERVQMVVDELMFSGSALDRITTYQMIPAPVLQQFFMKRQDVQFEPSLLVPEYKRAKLKRKRPPLHRTIVREIGRAVRKFRYRTIPRLVYRGRFEVVPFD
ncbi:glycosyltransferase family 25 protein [Nitratireductor thuwali]|uniref:Lipooligosaccharide biosynthesis protein lex-1 n=1 Tax=Nitratireductor thuwali TaxID=2267699 RepID=A0ABY5MFW4_9HYPH|nr:Lipooligosaccharide biosynthesis protein lex-1 [Nitratireductor thuwali]